MACKILIFCCLCTKWCEVSCPEGLRCSDQMVVLVGVCKPLWFAGIHSLCIKYHSDVSCLDQAILFFYNRNRANKSLLRYNSKQLGHFLLSLLILQMLSSLWLLAAAILIRPAVYLGSVTGKKEEVPNGVTVSGSVTTDNQSEELSAQ